jgi:hypothetical protein
VKITNKQLKKIIKEELSYILNEARQAFVFIDPSGNIELQNVSLDDSQNWNIPARLLDNQSYNALMTMNGKSLGQQGAEYFFNMISRLNANADKLDVNKLARAMVVTNR